jgi:dihydrofolate reductase
MKKRRKCSLIAAVSLDGKISDGSNMLPDWTSKEDWKQFQELLAKCDLVIAGRKTYELVKSKMDKRNTIVMTSAKSPASLSNVRFVDPKKDDIGKLMSVYKNIGVVGGAGVYNYFMKLGLCTDLYLTLEPVILGEGISLFGDDEIAKQSFTLVDKRQLNKRGSMLLHYQINT